MIACAGGYIESHLIEYGSMFLLSCSFRTDMSVN